MNNSAIACRVLWNQLPELGKDYSGANCHLEHCGTRTSARAQGLKGDLVCLRSVVGTGHAIHVLRQQAHDRLPLKSMKATLSKDAAERIRCLTARLASVPGSAFFPRCRTLGSQRGIMYIWTDASGDKDCGPGPSGAGAA